MSREILRWLSSLALGAATAALAWIQGHSGTGPAIDPIVSGLVVAILSKIVNFLTSKLPTAP